MAPLTYKNLTKVQLANFESQKMYDALGSAALSDSDRSKVYRDTYDRINKINFSLLVDGIQKIITPDGEEVTERDQIVGFCNNTDAKTVDEIQTLLGGLRNQTQIPNLKIKATEEQIKGGVPATYEVPLTFDNSNFFV